MWIDRDFPIPKDVENEYEFCVQREASPPVSDSAAPSRPKTWNLGRTIFIAFLNGDEELREKVERCARRWLDCVDVNLSFSFITETSSSDIRIQFLQDAPGNPNDSYVGTENLLVPKDKPTMRLALDGHTNEAKIKRVVLHEFGHVLGATHKHQIPEGDIAWDEEAVISDHRGIWDAATVKQKIFDKVKPDDDSGGHNPEIDQSVVLYAVPSRWTRNGFSSHWGDDLSAWDIEFVRQLYAPSLDVVQNSPTSSKMPLASNSDIAAIYLQTSSSLLFILALHSSLTFGS